MRGSQPPSTAIIHVVSVMSIRRRDGAAASRDWCPGATLRARLDRCTSAGQPLAGVSARARGGVPRGTPAPARCAGGRLTCLPVRDVDAIISPKLGLWSASEGWKGLGVPIHSQRPARPARWPFARQERLAALVLQRYRGQEHRRPAPGSARQCSPGQTLRLVSPVVP
jgi:hypothetical protein